MSVWVIIPVKPLQQAKSRLSGVITPEQRLQFAEALLRRTLEVVRDVPQVAGALVVSRDPKVLAIAREYKAYTVLESGAPELNAALMRATQVIVGWRGNAVLILPADLPLLSREDVIGITEMGREERTVVIATDRHEDGTNALLARPPGMFAYAYGPGSYRRHASLARQAGAQVKLFHSTNLLLDIDLPEDLEKYQQLTEDGNHASLKSLIPDRAN
jgi:2-phospho-L-lactate/phosphoenolpyruvate guanylyltransferase